MLLLKPFSECRFGVDVSDFILWMPRPRRCSKYLSAVWAPRMRRLRKIGFDASFLSGLASCRALRSIGSRGGTFRCGVESTGSDCRPGQPPSESTAKHFRRDCAPRASCQDPPGTRRTDSSWKDGPTFSALQVTRLGSSRFRMRARSWWAPASGWSRATACSTSAPAPAERRATPRGSPPRPGSTVRP